MYYYPAIFEQAEEGGYIAHFPQFGGFTQGETIEEVTELCEDLLISYIEDYIALDKIIPAPDKIKKGQYAIALPSSMVLKVLLHNELISQRVTKAKLARLMNTSPAEVQRITNLKHNTKIDTLDNAFKSLGKRLSISVI